MSISAAITNIIRFGGDYQTEFILQTVELDDSPGVVEIKSLAIGDTTIPVPAVTGFTVHGVVIIPPDGNTDEFIMKGAIGDVGFLLSVSRPTVLQFNTAPADIVFESAAVVDGIRFIWF